jgi:hypothetical protein
MSKLAGTLAGRVAVHSKQIADCVKNLATAKPEPSTKVTESIKSQARKRIAETEKKKATSKQARLREKTDKSKPLNGPQRCSKPKAGERTSIAAKSQKHQPLVIKKKEDKS